jgi:hypothetical protein
VEKVGFLDVKFGSELLRADMTTSALSLSQLLLVANARPEPKLKFLSAIADHLGLIGDDAEVQALSVLVTVIFEIERDINSLPVEDEMKNHLLGMLAHFNGIRYLSQAHMDLQHAKANFLKEGHILGLTNIHLALTGHVEKPTLSKDAKELAKRFNDVRDDVLNAELPESLKKILLKRTSQISSILDHFYAFGAQSLEEELEGLVGALVVHSPKGDASSGSLHKKLAVLAMAGLGILTAVDTGLGKTISIAESATKLVEIFDEDVLVEPGQEPSDTDESLAEVP